MSQQQQPLGGLALLAEAFRAKRTGQLVLGDGAATLRVRLEAGHVVALGPAPAETSAALPMPKPNDSVKLRLERVLAEIGVRKPPLAGPKQEAGPPGTLREQVIERLADDAQPARFEADDAPAPDLVPVAVATEPLILEAVRQMRHDEAVRAALGDLDRLLVAAHALAEERTLTLTEGYLLSRIDGLLSARQVLQLVPLDERETERALLGLSLTGRVEWRPASAPAARPTGPRAETPASGTRIEIRPEPGLAPRPAAEPQAEPLPVVWPEGDAEPAPSADVPAASPSPTPEATPAPAEAGPPDEEPVVEAIPEDEGEPAAGPSAPIAPPPVQAQVSNPAQVPAQAPAQAPAQPPEPATMSRRREILEFFQSLPLKNHFGVLGLEPGCTDAEARQAYVGLVKRFHPDAQRDRRLEDLHDILEAITIRVGEAWEVLGEAKSRASYESRNNIVRRSSSRPDSARADAAAGPPLPTAPANPEPEGYVAPEEILFRARRLLAQARYWDAIQVLETALPGMEPPSQQHRGRLLLARAYSKNPNWLRRAEEMLHELMREDPTNADVHYELGLLYKTGGFVARAQGMFKRALELRPGHKEAAAELGIQPTTEESGGGLLKRLFKRGKAS